ncbi:MAG: hypothetical protein ACOX69_07610 [Coriobacteriales bacterium]
MARKKSAEELAIEAELAAAKEAQSTPRKDTRLSSASGDAAEVVPERGDKAEDLLAAEEKASAVSKKKHAKPHIDPDGKFSWLLTKKGKVLLAVAIVAVLVIVVAVVLLVRWNSTDTWDGTEDTSWYQDGKSSYTFTTAEQLAGLRKLCEEGNTFEGVSISLGNNIDMYDSPFKPIGSGVNDQGNVLCFSGNFDGTGHTIKGLNIEEDTYDDAGLFGACDGGIIENLTVEGKVTGQVRVGGVIGEASGTVVRNCTNRCKVSSLKTATSYYPVSADVGGVVGAWLAIFDEGVESAEISNLTNEGEVSARACSVGGVVGSLINTDGFTLTARDFSNSGTVTVYCESDERDEAVGGVVGQLNALGTTTVENFENTGNVSCSSVLSVGGVFGAFMPQADHVKVSSCSNSGRISANSKDERAHIGGIAGYLDDDSVNFDNCSNSGELVATNNNTDDLFGTGEREVWDEWEDAHPDDMY